VKWTGKKLGVRDVIWLLGSNEELIIQYTGNNVKITNMSATTRHNHVIRL
jgi:hypothetical protein